ncbi:MAG: hypothetical protein WB792_07035 [Desulfobacterales bacterium]
MMKKIFLVLSIVPCIVVVLVSGTGLYLYYHPDLVKPVFERSLSASTGTSCTIEKLSYSLKLMTMEAKGISLRPSKAGQALSVKIPSIRVDMGVEGPWGHRSLVLKNIQISGLVLDLLPGEFGIPGSLPAKRAPSFPGGMVRDLIGFFFFRDIRFQSGELLDGSVSAVLGGQSIRARQIHAAVNADQPLSLSFALDVDNSRRHMNFTAPKVNIFFDKTFDIKDLKFSGTLRSQNMNLKDPQLALQRTDAASKFTYTHTQKTFKLEDLKVQCQGIVLPLGLTKTGSSPVSVTAAQSLSMETALTYDMNQRELSLVDPKLHVGGLTLMGKASQAISPLDIDIGAQRVLSQYPMIEIEDVTVQIPKAKINVGIRNILIGDIHVHIPDGRMDLGKSSFELTKVRFEAMGLKNILMGAHLRKRLLNVSIQGNNTGLLRAAKAFHLLPLGWNFKVRDAIRIDVEKPVSGPWQMHAKLSFDDFAFQNKDGSIIGENISIRSAIKGIVDSNLSIMRFSADTDADAGEALYDRYYLNLKKTPIVTSLKCGYDLQKRLLKISKLRIDLTGILPLEIQGLLHQAPAKTKADFTVTLSQTPMEPIFQYFLQEPYKTEKPFLATLETKGTVSAKINLKETPSTLEVTGRMEWLGGHISLPGKGIDLKGIQLDLPVWYRTSPTNAPAKTLKGQLSIQSAMVPFLPGQPLDLPLNIGPNRVSTVSPTHIKVPGGDLNLGSVHVHHLFGADLSVQTRLAFDDIKLEPLLSKIWARPLKGSLTGILDPVRYDNHTIFSRGKLTAKAFGGSIVFSDLGASGIFTPAPVFKFNAKGENLLLSEMTTDTAFGKIQGVLAGDLRNVEMADGQPQRFNLLLETIRKKGIPQKISIKAVENIAQIGGGQNPFMGLAGAFASFFKTFPYEKIGIQASLENDVFTIHGTIKENGTEYFVKRGAFSGVNIVNQNPDNRISFKDMVNRIKRIGVKGGPVIK